MQRFSLIGLLMFVTCLACGFFAWTNARELQKARSEISDLRSRLGVLDVIDSDKLHVVNVVAVPPTCRWQVYIPERDAYRFEVVIDGIAVVPDAGETRSVVGIPPGEHIVTADIGNSSGWAISYGINNGSSSKSVSLNSWGPISKDERVSCLQLAGSQTNTIDPQRTEQIDGDLLLCEWSSDRDDRNSDVGNSKRKRHSVELWIKKYPARR